MKVRPHALTIAFYLASALWFTAIRYGSQSFYGWLIAPVVQTMLGIGILGLFCAAMLLAGWRGLRTHSIPWVDAAIAGCSLVGSK